MTKGPKQGNLDPASPAGAGSAITNQENTMRQFDMTQPFPLSILRGLQHKTIYQGTVDPVTVQERRAANRRARRSRRINRLRAS